MKSKFSAAGLFLSAFLLFGVGCESPAKTLPEQAKVVSVIDGDTIEIAGGRRVRYLGIDTPEVRVRIGDAWVERPEPMGREAAEANRDWVSGQVVRLEFDAVKVDKYGRLLAYVYVGSEMVNERLLAQGLAEVLIIPPNGKYA